MKGNMMILAPLWFLLCWMSPEGSMAADAPIPLSMEEDSIDDMYFGCKKEMWKLVQKQYLKKEKKHIFWDHKEIKKCTKDNVKKHKKTALTKDELRAICIYTAAKYREFNPAVRTEAKIYGSSSFKYHSLHFLLTSAIQILNPDHKKCFTVYRKTDANFIGNVSDIIRFGTFTSSSLGTHLTNFGANSCFKIETCSGADLTNYAMIPEQKEVLIPPYEVFKITETYDGKGKFPDLKDCRKVFVLKSVGGKSKLNCKLIPEKQKPICKILKFFKKICGRKKF